MKRKPKENNIKEEIEMEKETKNIKIVGKLEYTFEPAAITTWFKEALDAFKEDSHEGKSFVEETVCMESHLSKDFNKLVKANNYSSHLKGAPIEDVVSLAFTFCPKKQIVEFAITTIHKNDTCTDIPGSEYIYNIPKHLMNEYNIIVCPYTDADFSEMVSSANFYPFTPLTLTIPSSKTKESFNAIKLEKGDIAYEDKDGVLIEIKASKDRYTVQYNGTVVFVESRKPSEPSPSINPDSGVHHSHLDTLDDMDMDEEENEEPKSFGDTYWYDLSDNPCYRPTYPLKNPNYPFNTPNPWNNSNLWKNTNLYKKPNPWKPQITGKYNKYIIRYSTNPRLSPLASFTSLLMKYVFDSNDVKIFRSAKTPEEIQVKRTQIKEFLNDVRTILASMHDIEINTFVIGEILLRQLITDGIASDILTYYTSECIGEFSHLVILHLNGLSNEAVSVELCNILAKATKDIKDNQKWYDVLAKPDVIKILDTIIISNHIGKIIGPDTHELIIG